MSLKLTVGPIDFSHFERAINNRLAYIISERLNRAAREVRTHLPRLVERHIYSSHETDLIMRGKERHELGLVSPQTVIDNIIDRIVEFATVHVVEPKPYAGVISGSLFVALLRKDYIDALRADGATFVSEHGFDVPWVEWLLLKDGEKAVLGFRYVDKVTVHSRTGKGVMEEVSGSSWTVPESIQGDRGDNWLLRALQGIQQEIGQIMARAIGAR